MTKKDKILKMTAEGKKAVEIAKKLNISVAQVYVTRNKAKKEAEAKEETVEHAPRLVDMLKMFDARDAIDDRKPTEPFTWGSWEADKNDPVHHPAHYNRGGIETIDVIEAWDLNYRLGNVVKYISRAPHKGNYLEDLKKARWYLDREIEKLGAANNE